MTRYAISALCFALLLTGSAMAFPLTENHSRDDVRSACASSGGEFYGNLDGYGCFKKNCDGKGGSCAVDCNASGQCDGTVPPSRLGGTKNGQTLGLKGTLNSEAKK